MDYFALHKDSDFIAHKGGFKYIDKEWVKGKWNYIYDTGAKAAHKVGTTATNASAQTRQAMSNAGNQIQNTSRAVALRAGSATAKARQQLATGTNAIASRAKNAAKVVSNTIDTKVTGKSYKKGMQEATRLITQATAGNISKVNRVVGDKAYEENKKAYANTLAGKIDAKKKDKAMASIIAKKQSNNNRTGINAAVTQLNPMKSNKEKLQDPNGKRYDAEQNRIDNLRKNVSQKVRDAADKKTGNDMKQDLYKVSKKIYDDGKQGRSNDNDKRAANILNKHFVEEKDANKIVTKAERASNREAAAQKVVDAVVNKPVGAIVNAANKVKSDVNEKVLQGVNKLGYSEKERLNMAKYNKDKATEEMKKATSNAIQARKAHNAQQEKSYGENGAVAQTDAARKRKLEAYNDWDKKFDSMITAHDKYQKARKVYRDTKQEYNDNPTPNNQNRVDRADKEWVEASKEYSKTEYDNAVAREKYTNAKREVNRYDEAKDKQLSRSLEVRKKYDQASIDLRRSLNNNKHADKSLQYALNLYKDTPLGKLEEKAKTSKTAKKAYDAIMAYMAKQT